jgi:hypothetical protein
MPGLGGVIPIGGWPGGWPVNFFKNGIQLGKTVVKKKKK